jgi:hypothetical protein
MFVWIRTALDMYRVVGFFIFVTGAAYVFTYSRTYSLALTRTYVHKNILGIVWELISDYVLSPVCVLEYGNSANSPKPFVPAILLKHHWLALENKFFFSLSTENKWKGTQFRSSDT